MAATLSLKRRTRRLSLAFLGEGWEDAYVEILRANYEEGAKIDAIYEQEKGVKGLVLALKVLFVGGKGLDASGKLIDLTTDHLDLFDADAILEMTQQMTEGEQPDPKAEPTSSNTSSTEDPSPSDSSGSSTENASDSPPSS